MRRFVMTSAGPLVLDYGVEQGARFALTIKRYAASGWFASSKVWIAVDVDGQIGADSVRNFLTDELRLPMNEAERLAASATAEWRSQWEQRSEPDKELKTVTRGLYLLLVALLVVAFAVLGVALLLWLLL